MPPNQNSGYAAWLICSIILVNFYFAHVAPPNLIIERTPWWEGINQGFQSFIIKTTVQYIVFRIEICRQIYLIH